MRKIESEARCQLCIDVYQASHLICIGKLQALAVIVLATGYLEMDGAWLNFRMRLPKAVTSFY